LAKVNRAPGRGGDRRIEKRELRAASGSEDRGQGFSAGRASGRGRRACSMTASRVTSPLGRKSIKKVEYALGGNCQEGSFPSRMHAPPRRTGQEADCRSWPHRRDKGMPGSSHGCTSNCTVTALSIPVVYSAFAFPRRSHRRISRIFLRLSRCRALQTRGIPLG